MPTLGAHFLRRKSRTRRGSGTATEGRNDRGEGRPFALRFRQSVFATTIAITLTDATKVGVLTQK